MICLNKECEALSAKPGSNKMSKTAKPRSPANKEVGEVAHFVRDSRRRIHEPYCRPETSSRAAGSPKCLRAQAEGRRNVGAIGGSRLQHLGFVLANAVLRSE